MDIFDKIKKAFLSDSIIDSKQSGQLNNRVLYKELLDHFEAYIRSESVGRRMIYPMAFDVMLSENDYISRKDALKLVLPEVVDGFYEIVRKYADRYPNFVAPANYFFFQFAKDREQKIEPGKMVVAATLHTLDFSQITSSSEINVHVSVKPVNSDVDSLKNINKDILVGFDRLDEGVFKFDVKPELKSNPSNSSHQSPSPNSEIADFSYSLQGATEHIRIKAHKVEFSGQRDTRKLGNIAIIKSDNVDIPHFTVLYSPQDNSFQLAAFGKTRLNQVPVPLSTGANLIWTPLPNNSTILLNDYIQLKFKKLS
ncbi:MAG: hypothetical protein LBR64_04760 [Dysgonamonadaceae bacterium]|jgi:hypothetical protein|nr:hypothetical protein [Dysgonamonadaceae bacterium]